jgi:hypothetical protein
MSCNIKVPFTGTPESIVTKARNAISKAGGTFDGNDATGSFGLSTPVGDVRGAYTVNGNVLEVTISEKPFFVSCDMIESQLAQYINK